MNQSMSGRLESLHLTFRERLKILAQSRPFAKLKHQQELFDITTRILREPGGPDALAQHGSEFEPAGVFIGGDWAHPEILRPELVGATLRSDAHSLGLEALSQLRMLAIARGEVPDHPTMSAEQARQFLESAVSRNIDLMMGRTGEAERLQSRSLRLSASGLVGYIARELSESNLVDVIVDEIQRVLEQRPILLDRARGMITAADEMLRNSEAEHPEARALIEAMKGPTEKTRNAEDMEAWRDVIASMSEDELRHEAEKLGLAMRRTGLVCAAHAELIREAARRQSMDLVATGMNLDSVGRDSLLAYRELCMSMIDRALWPTRPQVVLSLASLLERGILFFPPVAPGLWRLMGLELHPEVSEILREAPGAGSSLEPEERLLAGTIATLGQPLGVGQGDNPTCQSARAISLWAQCDPGFLLELITWAARDNEVDVHFEGERIRSCELSSGLIEELHLELDPVSLVLVPHLDRVYMEMGRQTLGREGDGHRWINPEFHGWWVHRGFASVIDYNTGAISCFEDFQRLFAAAYHPLWNGGRVLIYPQPAGIAATTSSGAFVGWHAVSIQRVTIDSDGAYRVYFYNPNNEGRQDWGAGVVTTTTGHGERPGESSLSFAHFASRLYLFHYNEREVGDRAEVPEEELELITDLTRASWGAERAWVD